MKLESFIQIFILCFLVSHSQACVSDLQQFINNLINIITPPTPTPTTNTTTTPEPTTTTTTPFGYCPYGSVFNGTQCEECGLSDFADNLKIFNGIEAVPHSWPSQVLIYREYTFKINGVMAVASDMCGGTLIKRNVVLTAGHCITDEFIWKGNKVKYVPNVYNPTFESTFLVYLGLHDISFIFGATALPDHAQNPSVAKAILHKDYNETTLQHDIGLLILDNSVDLNSYVKLACLPEKESTTIPKPNLPAWVLGWGLNQNYSLQLKLQNVKISTYNSSMCSEVLPQIPKIWDAQICAGDYNGNKDSCQGDSGGPLFIQETIGDATKRIVAGVVSFGDGCGSPNKPGIYTRVSYYLDWIELEAQHFNSTSSIL